jgi:2'-hydroxyisoflavone reductase
MRLLFVGGTSFVGRHAVESAVAAGHDVTVLHRGRTNDELLAGLDGIASATTEPP